MMEFSLDQSIEILERTPNILDAYLNQISEDWLRHNEGENTWSPYDIAGHLVFGEKTDWMARIKIILNDSENKLFEPFDRFAQQNEDQNRPVSALIEEFRSLRNANLKELKSLNIQQSDYSRIGLHPAFGQVTLAQLISSWVVHDLGHIAQISRVMSKQYKTEVGPWVEYMSILNK